MSALAALPRMQRDLLALVLLGEHTRGQAAVRVGVSHDAAAGMLTQALRTVGGLDPSKGDGIATVAAASRTPFGLFARPRAVGRAAPRVRKLLVLDLGACRPIA